VFDGAAVVEGWLPLFDWRLIEVQGRDSERFLASQLTSDVRALEVGASQPSALLDRTGRLQAMLFVQRTSTGYRLLVPRECTGAFLDHVDRFVIGDDVQVSTPSVSDMRLTLGPVTWGLNEAAEEETFMPLAAYGCAGGVTWDGSHPEAAPLETTVISALSVLSGFPRWGREARSGQLVTETTLAESAVSHTKGCYLGQETVAKILAHRGAARYPVLLTVDSDVDVAQIEGLEVTIDGRKAGVVLAVAKWNDRWILQSALHRDFRIAGLEVRFGVGDGQEYEAEVVELPVIRPPTSEERAEALFHAAVARFESDDEEGAISLLKRTIGENAAHADAYETLGVILGRHGRYEEAIGWMRELAEVDPDSVMAHTNMSLFHNQLGRMEEAECEAQAAVSKQLELERRADDLVQDVEDHVVEDRLRRGEMFRQVLEIDPDDAVAHFGMGELLLEMEKPNEAVRHFESALEANPRLSAAFVGWGKALEDLQHVEQAIDVYRRGVSMAASRGDLKAANRMHERLSMLNTA